MKSTIDPLSIAAVSVTVVSFSATAPLTAAASASPLAMAFWRNALGFTTLVLVLLVLRRGEFARVARGERGLLRREQWRPMALGFLAATSLALHFATFMTSTRLTSVAMSTALVATQPVWQALIAAAQGARMPRGMWVGLGISVLGAIAAGGLDIRSGGTALLGDLLALAGAITLAGYTALSGKARSDVSTPLYSVVSSFVCALELLAVCWLADIPLTGFDSTTQLSLIGLLLLPQLLGLGSLNFVLGRASATTVSVVLLLESPVAALAAWWLMGQRIDLATVPGLLLIIVGVTVVVLTSSGGEQAAPRQGKHRRGAPPYPAHPPYTPQLPSSTGESTTDEWAPTTASPAFEAPLPTSPQRLRHHVERDPRVHWAGHLWNESPTLTLTYHGAGVYDTVYLGRPSTQEEETDFDGPLLRPRRTLANGRDDQRPQAT